MGESAPGREAFSPQWLLASAALGNHPGVRNGTDAWVPCRDCDFTGVSVA